MWGKVHQRIANQLDSLGEGDRGLFLIPRGHLKSTLVTQGWVLQQLLRNPRVRVLISSAKKEHAQGFLDAIKRHIDLNPEFISRFGNLRDDARWTREAINIKGHSHGDKEATITTGSLQTESTSQHYDLIVLDDIINREYANTEEQRQKCVNYYMDCLDLLEPDGRMIVIGTRWHFADIYSKLIEQNKKNKVFQVIVDEPVMRNPKFDRRQFKEMVDDPETQFLFPEKFNHKEIKRIYLDKVSKPNGYYEFSCQQMNFPVSDLNAKFRFEDIKFVKSLPSWAVKYITLDPAGSERITKSQDDTAICVTGISPQLDIYNIDCWAEQTTASGVFHALNNIYMQYPDTRKIGIETNFNHNNAMYIKEHFPDMRNKLVEYRAGTTQSKDGRTMALQPYVALGKFHMLEHDDGIEYSIGGKVVKLHPGQYKLLVQMIDFGSTEHDDAIDAQAATLEFMCKPAVQVDREDYEYEPDNSYTGY